MTPFNRTKVGRSFHNQAAEYDHHATVQKRVVARLLSLVKNHCATSPTRILDVGCGTGQLLSGLQQRYPQSSLFGLDLAYNMAHRSLEMLGTRADVVNGDAESLPFRSESFDTVVSSSTLQWLDTLDPFLNQAFRVMSSNGLLCAALFGGGTLCELRECFREVVKQKAGNCSEYMNRLHQFKDSSEVEAALEKSAFVRPVVIRDWETEYYSDVYDLLRSIKRIGAGPSSSVGGRAGLGWKGILAETSRLYTQRYGTEGRIPATYEVVYVLAEKRNDR